MTPSERLMQRLGVDASKTAKQQPAQERQAAKPREEKPEQMQYKPEGSQRKPTLATPGVVYSNRPDNRPVQSQQSAQPTAQATARPSPLQSAQAQGRPADRLTARLAAPTPNQPSQGRPGPSAQRQQAQSGPAARLDARLASGGTEKIAAAMAQQKQRGPTPGRGM